LRRWAGLSIDLATVLLGLAEGLPDAVAVSHAVEWLRAPEPLRAAVLFVREPRELACMSFAGRRGRWRPGREPEDVVFARMREQGLAWFSGRGVAAEQVSLWKAPFGGLPEWEWETVHRFYASVRMEVEGDPVVRRLRLELPGPPHGGGPDTKERRHALDVAEAAVATRARRRLARVVGNPRLMGL
jgi:hypothetical protein